MENAESGLQGRQLTISSATAWSAADIARCSTIEARAFLPLADAASHTVLPLHLLHCNRSIVLHCAAVEDSPDVRARLRFLCGIEVSVTVVPRLLLEEGITRAYLGSTERLSSGLSVISDRHAAGETTRGVALLPEPKGDAAKFLAALLEFGVARGASDLHLCPTKNGAVVKIRIDGELMIQDAQPYPVSLHEQVVLRLKALAGLDMACRRLPQDGAFTFPVAGKERAARLSILPALHAESAVVRFLYSRDIPAIEKLGLESEIVRMLRGATLRTQGIVLITGPTGSGKSTTLYAAAREIKESGRNVVTVEDPIESHIPGVVQIAVNEQQGLSYPLAIRSVLRHDPNVIVIGEMRDCESAGIALDSAATGHLTLSSLHVGSALLALERLAALGLSRERSVPVVSLVVTQRLMPVLCGRCKQRDDIASRGLNADVYAPTGCESCNDSGFLGRVAVGEALDLRSDAAKGAALLSYTTAALRAALPAGAFIAWEHSLRALMRAGMISARQASEFLERES